MSEALTSESELHLPVGSARQVGDPSQGHADGHGDAGAPSQSSTWCPFCRLSSAASVCVLTLTAHGSLLKRVCLLGQFLFNV